MGKIIKHKKIIIFLVILGIFSVSSVVLALQVSWPPSPAGTRLTDDSQLGDLIKYLYEWGIFLGGLAAFIALLIAGFQYLTSVGDPARMKDAMDRIKSAFFGLVLLLGSWLILNTISSQFTTFPPLELVAPTSMTPPYPTCETVPGRPAGDCCEKVPPEQKDECLRQYKCENNYCIPVWQPTEPCKSVTFTGGVTGITNSTLRAADKCQPRVDEVVIQAGRSFSASSTPGKCAGILQLFGKPNCEDMRAAVDVNVKFYTVDADIKSILLFAPEE